MSLPLNIIANVTVVANSPQVAAPLFNLGLVIGNSTVISTATRMVKVLQSTWSSQMLGLGFTASSPEYIFAGIYFSQPSPPQALMVGVQGNSETPLQAFTACRLANSQWYAGTVLTAADADHTAIAAYVQSQVGTVYFGWTNDAAVLNGTANNILDTLYASNSSRTWMTYATTQSGLYPNNIYINAAIMARALGSNTQLANSAYTMKFSAGQPLVGVAVEPLTPTQVTNIEGTTPAQGPNGNVYINYAGAFNVLEQGTMMAPLTFFDQVLNLDILAAQIQYNIMNLLVSSPKVPQTDAGQQLLVQAVEQALNQAVTTGFIAGGTWQGQPLTVGNKTVAPGTALPNGFIVLTPSYTTLTQAQILARQAPPIYVLLIEAGAVHFVTIQVLVQA